MRIIAERTFSLEDQLKFAALSGDANPMHVDEVAARRTVFGAPVVHGLHLLCWALDSWFSGQNQADVALTKITGSFDRGVLPGETVHASVVDESNQFTLVIRREQTTMSTIKGTVGPPVSYSEELPALRPATCREVDYAGASNAHGALPLAYSATDAARMFPHLNAVLPPFQVATLLTSTRLVGMECPGLHSLYRGLEFKFEAAAQGKPEMRYYITEADARFSQLRIAVDGPGFQGTLRALVRPAPCAQATFQELAELVQPSEFGEQRAVVVGGSRGLGEIAAKLLAAGGADVTITFHRGKTDAEKVAAEINRSGGRCAVSQLDATHPVSEPGIETPSHIYYFATPHITSDKTVVFSGERFAEYVRYYVTGFADTVTQLARDAKALQVLYPSTVFLAEPPHMPEYCAAKAAGEEVCRQLAGRHPGWRIHFPRLPRMMTDQNNGFAKVEAAPPQGIILQQLRNMKP